MANITFSRVLGQDIESTPIQAVERQAVRKPVIQESKIAPPPPPPTTSPGHEPVPQTHHPRPSLGDKIPETLVEAYHAVQNSDNVTPEQLKEGKRIIALEAKVRELNKSLKKKATEKDVEKWLRENHGRLYEIMSEDPGMVDGDPHVSTLEKMIAYHDSLNPVKNLTTLIPLAALAAGAYFMLS